MSNHSSFFFLHKRSSCWYLTCILVDVINFCLDELLTSMWICAFNAKRNKFKLSVRFIYKYGQENANRSIYHYFHDKMSLVLFVFFNLHTPLTRRYNYYTSGNRLCKTSNRLLEWTFHLFFPECVSGGLTAHLFFKYISQFWWRQYQFGLGLINEIGNGIRGIVSIHSTDNIIDIRNQDAFPRMDVCNMSFYAPFS